MLPWILIAYQQFSPMNVSWKPSSLAGTTIVSISDGSIVVVVVLFPELSVYEDSVISARNG